MAGEAEARRLTEGLLRRGVVIRPLGAFGLPHCVRISTGSDEENETFSAAVVEAMRD